MTLLKRTPRYFDNSSLKWKREHKTMRVLTWEKHSKTCTDVLNKRQKKMLSNGTVYKFFENCVCLSMQNLKKKQKKKCKRKEADERNGGKENITTNHYQ